MSLGIVDKQELRNHLGHNIEIAEYRDNLSITIECLDCGCVLIDTEEELGE